MKEEKDAIMRVDSELFTQIKMQSVWEHKSIKQYNKDVHEAYLKKQSNRK
jgi:hypothetical protein